MVLSVAYHNIGVEYEFLKEYQQSLNAYRKSIENAEKNLTGSNDMVDNLKNVYYAALEKVGGTVKKTVLRKLPKKATNKNVKLDDVQQMLDSGMHEEEIVDFYQGKLRNKKEHK